MSYPKIAMEEATPEQVKALLDSGHHVYIEFFQDAIWPVFKNAEGKYVLDVDARTGRVYEYEGTNEGLARLAFFVAFSGMNYAQPELTSLHEV